MNFLNNTKGKTKGMTSEGVSATEKFQRVFLRTFEDIEKVPISIKDLFLSNIIYRVFSHAIYQTIDGKNASFFPEKVKSNVLKYSVSNTADTLIPLDENIVKRSKYIGVEVFNDSYTSDCDVHIQVQSVVIGSSLDDLYFFSVPPQTDRPFQFLCPFTQASIVLRQQTSTNDVYLKIYYLPL